MKHNVGDLVAVCDVSNWMNPVFHLGYIQSMLHKPDTYLIYFFHTENTVWYSEDRVDAFKQNMKELNRFDGKREIDWKPGKRVKQ